MIVSQDLLRGGDLVPYSELAFLSLLYLLLLVLLLLLQLQLKLSLIHELLYFRLQLRGGTNNVSRQEATSFLTITIFISECRLFFSCLDFTYFSLYFSTEPSRLLVSFLYSISLRRITSFSSFASVNYSMTSSSFSSNTIRSYSKYSLALGIGWRKNSHSLTSHALQNHVAA